jgi:hypothetical protein
MVDRGFTQILSDPCVYVRRNGQCIEIVTVWVDDLLLFTNTKEVMVVLKRELNDLFDITDIGEPCKIVGIEMDRDREAGTLRIMQTKYVESLLRKYGLENANSVSMPMDPNVKLGSIQNENNDEPKNRSNDYASLIGSLMYLAVATRPDVTYTVYQLASFTADPGLQHWMAAKRVLRYLAGTRDWGITYRKITDLPHDNLFHGYSDASFADNEDQTSTTGFVFKSANAAITWNSKRHRDVSLSMMESEYMALSEAAREVMWLRNLYEELGFRQTRPTVLYGDNQGALALAVNPQFHKRSKHFKTKIHYVRERVAEQKIETKYCPTADMTADIFTKALPKPKHLTHVLNLGMTMA